MRALATPILMVKSYFQFFLIISFLILFSIPLAQAAPKDLNLNAFVAPNKVGPYRAGFLQTTATLSDRSSVPIIVWYPTADKGAGGQYVQTDVPVNLPSQFGAIKNASVASGKFPLIIFSHPGQSTQYNLSSMNSLNEILAGHGFIVAAYLESPGLFNATNCPATINDPRVLMTLMLNTSAGVGGSSLGGVDFLGRIDPNKIGAAGYSAGTLPTAMLIGGNASKGATADPRVKAAAIYEIPNLAHCGQAPADIQSITTPYLMMEGSSIIGPVSAQMVAQTTLALPRFHVHIPNVVHISYGDNCQNIDQNRETSFARQQAANLPLVDPLVNMVPTTVDQGVGTSNAFTNWNLDAVPGIGVVVGGARQFCNKVGVNSAFMPLDDGNGFTTIPPLNCTGPFVSGHVCDTFTPQVHPSGEQVNQYVYTYSTAFWEVYLDNDPRYKHFLTEDWTTDNFPGISMTPIGVK